MAAAHVDPALVLRRRALRRSEGRRRLAVLVGAIAIVLLPLGYWGLENSSIFAASQVSVTGATPKVDALVRAAVAHDVSGTSLLRVDASSLAAELEAIPDVKTASVDRAFPHTVAVSVVMERPAALVRAGKASYIVSVDGRVLRAVKKAGDTMPRLVLPPSSQPAAGHTVDSAQMRSALHVLAVAPHRFPATIAKLRKVVASPGGVVAVFGHGLQVRLGTAGSLDLKLHVAARVLVRMGDSIRRSVAYVDVSAPARPAIGYKK
ncbi:MAG TPA: FtsQ-type POTRA domain-containing protein [Gaiellales bacterium]